MSGGWGRKNGNIGVNSALKKKKKTENGRNASIYPLFGATTIIYIHTTILN